mmetsp:Transcript_29807/g.43834  ORF Transcript_29807/g.43834 Transcript_29807/m.43834 type:complete len:248 (+) Transcript_29807:2342-3085(+)
MNRSRVRNQANKLLIILKVILLVLSISSNPIQKVLNNLIRQLLNLQILGKVNKHRTRTSIPCHVKGIIHSEGHLGGILDLITPLGAGFHNVHGGTGLEGIHWSSGGGLSTKNNEGDTVTHGINDGSDKVGCPRSRGGNDDTSRKTSIGLGGTLGNTLGDMTRTRLVGVGNPANPFVLAMTGMAIMELIEQGQDGSARVPIDHLDAMLEKLGVDDVSGRIALEFVHVCSGGVFGGKFRRAIDEVVPGS